ncbi:MAG: hypothetical protein A2068_06990 [Ignavibacteria bacterium GWB2_35_6b]|nr:MAG: hypothetical protein A2068_06990 [Ignavibacteria bacterium GWB2_35_6b]
MSKHTATIKWNKKIESFQYKDYNREHEWIFDNGQKIDASASQPYLGKPEFVDPEEAFVAALSSCHLLTLLAICSRKNITVESYEDNAEGFLDKNENGILFLKKVILRPKIKFQDEVDDNTIKELHHLSHQECFLANTVKSEMLIEPEF